MRLFYLIMAALGASANPVAAFAWLDVLVSAVVLLAFIWSDGKRVGVKGLWLPTLGLCLIGVSFALPLYLWMREGRFLMRET